MRAKTQLAKWGTSIGVRIPKPILEAAQLHEGDSVALEVDHGTIVIRLSAARPTLEELVNGISDQNMHGETDWGGPREKKHADFPPVDSGSRRFDLADIHAAGWPGKGRAPSRVGFIAGSLQWPGQPRAGLPHYQPRQRLAL